jgi:hypothetical protein
MKEFIVKENAGFRLRVRSFECLAPKGLYSFEFINEELKDGKVERTSTYNYFLEESEIKILAEGLLR